jgi:voltage-dependent calcium channel
MFGSSSSPLQSEPTTGGISASLPAGATARQTSLNRGITQRLRRFQRSLLRPFELNQAPPALTPHATISGGGGSNYPDEVTPLDGGFSTATLHNVHLNTNFNTNDTIITNFNGQTQAPSHNQIHHRDKSITARLANTADRVHATIRQPSEPTYLSRVMQSDANPLGTGHPTYANGDVLSLPFRLSISNQHSKTQRNVPYLRQSWTRIDFLAILCFWITFGLATTGFEHGVGGLHIGVFRAISAIRTARLLTVTSGTTVSFFYLWVGSGRMTRRRGSRVIEKQYTNFLSFSKTIMHSLKTARPLLTSVAYFVVFAMVLFSYVFSFLILKSSSSHHLLSLINKHHLDVG